VRCLEVYDSLNNDLNSSGTRIILLKERFINEDILENVKKNLEKARLFSEVSEINDLRKKVKEAYRDSLQK